MSKFSKLTYEDLESTHINDPTFFYALSGFCIEDGNRDRIGNKTLTYFCRTCCSSSDNRIVRLNNEGRFKTIKRKSKNNKYPCACSKQKKRMMRALGVDLDLNTQYSRDKCIYTVESYSHTDANGLRLYNISCNVCSSDKELYPEPFKSYISTLEGRQYLCGCGGKRYYKKFQVEVLSRRLCEEIGYEFLTLSEKFKGITTKLTFRCDLGHETSNTSYHYLERG